MYPTVTQTPNERCLMVLQLYCKGYRQLDIATIIGVSVSRIQQLRGRGVRLRNKQQAVARKAILSRVNPPEHDVTLYNRWM